MATAKLQDKMSGWRAFLTRSARADELRQARDHFGGDPNRSIPLAKVIDAAYQFSSPIRGSSRGCDGLRFSSRPTFTSPVRRQLAWSKSTSKRQR